MHKVELTKERNTQTIAHKNIESVKQFTVKGRFQWFSFLSWKVQNIVFCFLATTNEKWGKYSFFYFETFPNSPLPTPVLTARQK